MAVKYTTATNVRNFLAGRVHGSLTDAMINVWIEEAEGIIDTWLRIGDGTNSASLTFSSSEKPHLILELASTAMAASIALANSNVSWRTMEEAVFMMETAIYWWETCERIIKDDHIGEFILEQ